MHIFRFKVGPKKVGIGGKQLKYVARPCYAPKLNKDDIVEQIAENNRGVNKGMIYGVLEAINQEFRHFLLNGHPVNLAGLGTFRVSFDSESKDEPVGFTDADIKNPRIIFTPDIALRREMLKELKFEEYKN